MTGVFSYILHFKWIKNVYSSNLETITQYRCVIWEIFFKKERFYSFPKICFCQIFWTEVGNYKSSNLCLRILWQQIFLVLVCYMKEFFFFYLLSMMKLRDFFIFYLYHVVATATVWRLWSDQSVNGMKLFIECLWKTSLGYHYFLERFTI